METVYKRRKIKGRSIDEHRFIMESHLGRKLMRHEVVHHIDGNKRNNSLSNLQLLSNREHSIIHNQKYAVVKNCEVCKREFTPNPTKRNRQKTCSYECRIIIMKKHSTSAKINDAQRNEIRIRFRNGEKGNKLALEYGITPQAVSYIINH
jgi:hypothetical protein